MAAAEARAVWQRTASRCFVQEDAKRAPKLACCQSSSSTSKQLDSSPTSSVDGPDIPPVSSMPLVGNPSSLNIPPDTRWWLHFQPCYGHQKVLTSEELSVLDSEKKALLTGSVDSTSGPCGVHMGKDSDSIVLVNRDDSVCSSKVSSKASADCMKTDSEFGMVEKRALHCNTLDHKLKGVRGHHNIANKNLDECKISGQINEPCFDSESSWILCEKTEPWWHTTDLNELASWVAEKSLDHLENCDLPPPHKHVRTEPYGGLGVSKHEEPYGCLGVSKHDGIVSPSLGQKGLTSAILNPSACAEGSPTSTGRNGRQFLSFEEDILPSSSEKIFSSSTTCEDKTDSLNISESDLTKAQLLEALRRSQTRAREAENAAKQAYAEKECIVRLVFRQASQLFAYKQWLRVLQLESFYAQMKSSDRPISTLFPVALPWMPHRGRKLKMDRQKASKEKRLKKSRPRCGVAKYATVFALGLGLVGAGLILGWTVGWMFPTF